MEITQRLAYGMQVAAVAHRNQKRKGGDIPYVVHPYAVMTFASTVTEDEDVLLACLFHDILEDVPEEYPREQMIREFGKRVVSIVEGVTKDDSIKDWRMRNEAYLHHLEHEATDESLLVSCADKLHNLMTVLEDYETFGDTLWDRFNAGKDDQKWWYRSVLSVVERRMPDLALAEQLRERVVELEKL